MSISVGGPDPDWVPIAIEHEIPLSWIPDLAVLAEPDVAERLTQLGYVVRVSIVASSGVDLVVDAIPDTPAERIRQAMEEGTIREDVLAVLGDIATDTFDERWGSY